LDSLSPPNGAGFFKPAPSLKHRQKTPILATDRHRFSANAPA